MIRACLLPNGVFVLPTNTASLSNWKKYRSQIPNKSRSCPLLLQVQVLPHKSVIIMSLWRIPGVILASNCHVLALTPPNPPTSTAEKHCSAFTLLDRCLVSDASLLILKVCPPLNSKHRCSSHGYSLHLRPLPVQNVL